jgi:hypothetical protein
MLAIRSSIRRLFLAVNVESYDGWNRTRQGIRPT